MTERIERRAKTYELHKHWIFILSVALLLFVGATFVSFWYVLTRENYDKQYIDLAGRLDAIEENMVRLTGDFINDGKESSFDAIKAQKAEFISILNILQQGRRDSVGNILLPPSPANIQNKQLANVRKLWTELQVYADVIAEEKNIIINIVSLVKKMSLSLERIQSRLLDVLNLLSTEPGVTTSDAEVGRQIYKINQIQLDLISLLTYDVTFFKLEKDLPGNVADFDMLLSTLMRKKENKAIYPLLLEIEREFSYIKRSVNDIMEVNKAIMRVLDAWNQMRSVSPKLLEAATALAVAYDMESEGRFVNAVVDFSLSVASFGLLALLLFLMYRQKQRDLKESNKKIQQLVNELHELASGNLAVHITVQEGITAAIADAIRYSLNALRNLVKSINETTEKVAYSIVEVKNVSHELIEGIHYQTREITNTGASMSEMAQSIDEVSLNAKESVQIARDSLQIAHEGAEIVNDTISGMERVREKIKETEGFIQLLSDRSTAIGEIVSIIDGVANQTNILSLNAAIQAASAGEIGIGFGAVADEVQVLAVKSSQAAKEVESIVRFIRGDTTKAVKSIELAIAEVNAGTHLAHNAGRALKKIEYVSENLAKVIQEISRAAEEQAVVSKKISKTMEVIDSIAKQTAAGTNTTAKSINNLSELLDKLHKSVAEFKLMNGNNNLYK